MNIKFFLPAWAVSSLLLMSTLVAAQDFEGVVSYDIEISMQNATPEMAARMPKKSVLYIKAHHVRQETKGGMMEQTMLIDDQKREVVMLMDMMGQKMAIKSTMDELEKNNTRDVAKYYDFKYTEETKTIAGFTCKKVLMIPKTPKSSNQEDFVMEVWYATDISNRLNELKQMPGLPLQYSMDAGVFRMNYTATSVERKKVADSLFEIPKDYTLTTSEQMNQMIPMLPSKD